MLKSTAHSRRGGEQRAKAHRPGRHVREDGTSTARCCSNAARPHLRHQGVADVGQGVRRRRTSSRYPGRCCGAPARSSYPRDRTPVEWRRRSAAATVQALNDSAADGLTCPDGDSPVSRIPESVTPPLQRGAPGRAKPPAIRRKATLIARFSCRGTQESSRSSVPEVHHPLIPRRQRRTSGLKACRGRPCYWIPTNPGR